MIYKFTALSVIIQSNSRHCGIISHRWVEKYRRLGISHLECGALLVSFYHKCIHRLDKLLLATLDDWAQYLGARTCPSLCCIFHFPNHPKKTGFVVAIHILRALKHNCFKHCWKSLLCGTNLFFNVAVRFTPSIFILVKMSSYIFSNISLALPSANCVLDHAPWIYRSH